MIQGVGMLSQEKVFDDRDEWRLLADELSLLPGMTDTGRLGFVLQLKFRQVQGHIPTLYTISLPVLCTPSLGRSDALPYPLKTIRFRDDRLSDTDNIFVAIWVSDFPIKPILHDLAPG